MKFSITIYIVYVTVSYFMRWLRYDRLNARGFKLQRAALNLLHCIHYDCKLKGYNSKK